MRWAPTWRHRFILAALWLFYRVLNVVGSSRGASPVDLSTELLDAVERYAVSGDWSLHVYNYGTLDGKVFTVMIAKVCDSGADPMHPPHV